MDHEVENLQWMVTFEEVQVNPNIAILGSKWVYKVKMRVDGQKETLTYKAHFIAQEFHQIWGCNFVQTHVPVVWTESLCFVITVTLYSLKQAGHIWNIEMDSGLKTIGFECSGTDLYLYLQKDQSSFAI